jgi:uncharacterized protein (DUF302 family)
MRTLVVLVATLLAAFNVSAQDNGIVTRPSRFSVAETAARLEAAIASSGVYKIFYKLDHAANAAQEAGTKIPPSQLILFGNPKGGAPLIKEAPSLAMDLPNRALVWEDTAGKVWVSYNDIASLFARHRLTRTEEQIKAIEARQKALFDKAIE